ncbi:4-hydroxybenzoate 3-monooxygenase [Agromyces aureus]|uniref:4-hydroxybenzoate 3-monooxygenase n=1 Tax=Agromyces aureus TaxID=453304 RepID=A0A191WG20_9MICO|nr:4-hydroxybenzoate 3-monooxygenase [Agromyces aureus]ANJ27128.1 4-hydroxybenzoate 3-monooxygenase [Agromyces aureus]
MRTQAVIIGAGPAGLLLGHILHRAGIGFTILEARSREQVLGRIRAGVLEQGSVDTLAELGLDADLRERGLTHHGIHLQFEGTRHHVDFDELVGRTVTVYGQQALVRHLLAEHDRLGSDIRFEVSDVAPTGLEGSPSVSFTDAGATTTIEGDVVVGADGFHGVCRPAIPGIRAFERAFPFGWLGILAEVPPSTDDLIYALHPDGFAMHSMRSPEVSRLYVQVRHDESIDDWSDARIWDALQTRLGVDGWTLHEGEVLEKSITPMRSFVASTMAHGRLFLVGDAAHIVPPTGAKGLNSAIADVVLLGRALVAGLRHGDESGLRGYSDAALARQWKVQQFSEWMTDLLHVHDAPDASAREFAYRSQVGRLEYVTGSHAALQSLAEQYAGLPFTTEQ